MCGGSGWCERPSKQTNRAHPCHSNKHHAQRVITNHAAKRFYDQFPRISCKIACGEWELRLAQLSECPPGTLASMVDHGSRVLQCKLGHFAQAPR